MTPNIKTLTAVAALALAAGTAMAQDTQTVPLAQPDDATISAPETGTTYVVNPDGSRAVLSAEATDEAADAAGDEADAAAADDDAAVADADADADAADDEAVAADADAEATEDAADTATDEAVAEDADADAPEDEATLAEDDAGDEADEAEVAADTEDEAADEVEVAAEDETADEAEVAADTEDEAADAVEVAAVEPEPVVVQEITDVDFSFEGPFGRYDSLQLQRGLQVYTEICSACHGLQYVPIRTLSDPTGPNMPEDQVRAFAAEMEIFDPELDDYVPRKPSDHFPAVVPLDGMGPDLSLMAKARAGFHGPYGTGLNQLFKGIGGPEYIYSILTHYTGETKDEAGTLLYENTAFPGGWISMAPPLDDDYIAFEDGHPTDLNSVSREVAAFLMWTAEPKMMQRKQMGTVAVIFLLVLSVLLYLTNRRLWLPHKHRKPD